MEDIFGEGSVLHFYEAYEPGDEVKMSDHVDRNSKKHSLWMYVNGEP
ncbi:MAG: hypothetical protein ABEJ87_02975 [Candidatus Nanohalobium sp.]